MGKVVAAGITAFMLSAVLAVADLFGVQLPFALAWVPFGVVSLAFYAVQYTINDGWLGCIQPDRIWAVLRELPAAVLALLGFLVVAQIAVAVWHLLYPGVESDVGMLGHFARVVAWISLVTCALAVGVQRQRRRATAGTLRPMDAGTKVQRVSVAHRYGTATIDYRLVCTRYRASAAGRGTFPIMPTRRTKPTMLP